MLKEHILSLLININEPENILHKYRAPNGFFISCS